jgi:cellulose synthase/poly-beta-1,6-N-acetylglucosamine synthase-like glycosyltransferase
MTCFLFQTRPFTGHAFGVASIVFAACALIGTVYALVFAIIGSFGSSQTDTANPVPSSEDISTPSTNFLVIIPAHNESSGLTATVKSVLAQNYPSIRCVVVADNCTDDTAEMAVAAGADEVLIRTDPEKRGKGYALSWAFDLMQSSPWDAVCVIDADSVLAPGFFTALDSSFRKGHFAVQARYDFSRPLDDKKWLEQFGAVAKAGENSFIYRSRERLGLSQVLMGNGFFLSRTALDRVPWRAHSIVEDAEHTLALGKKGIAVHYQEKARLWSRQASTVRDVHPQRVRWASGIWQLFRGAIPALIATGFRDRNWRALEEAFMLLMTSRMVLIYLLVISFLLSLAAPSFLIVTGSLLILTAALQLIYLMLMFRLAGDNPVPLKGLLFLPYYVAVILLAQVLAVGGFNRHLWRRTTR